MGASLDEAQKTFIKGLAIKYPDETGVRAFGLDDKQKQQLKEIFKTEGFKLALSRSYQPSEDEALVFTGLLDLA